MLRRVAPQTIGPLRRALADIVTTREELETRASRLSGYAALIVAGATSGAVTVVDTNNAADAATTR
jgi:enoyl reductase-like protein